MQQIQGGGQSFGQPFNALQNQSLDPNAQRFDELTYDDYLARDLKVADATAISLARDNKLPMIFFDLGVEGNILRVVQGEKIGTTVHA